MRKTFSLAALATVLVLVPLSVFAQTAGSAPTFEQWVNVTVVHFVDAYVMRLLYALAFILFLIGIFRYFFTGGEENRTKGRAFVLWGLIGMIALFSVWSIVKLLLTVIQT